MTAEERLGRGKARRESRELSWQIVEKGAQGATRQI